MMNIIECKNLSIGYNDHLVLNNLNFKLEEGMYLSIVGNNGSGKSTLLKTILGLIKPLKGKISINVLKSSEIGYLPQINENMKEFPASAYEIVLSGCLNKCRFLPFYSKKQKEMVNNNIKKLKIEKLMKKSFNDLSGGEKQKVLLARALSATNKLLILDEPTNGLDAHSQKDLYSLIKKLNKEGITIILVSHDIHKSLENASHILHLDNKETFFGTVDEYVKTGKCEHFIGGCLND